MVAERSDADFDKRGTLSDEEYAELQRLTKAMTEDAPEPTEAEAALARSMVGGGSDDDIDKGEGEELAPGESKPKDKLKIYGKTIYINEDDTVDMEDWRAGKLRGLRRLKHGDEVYVDPRGNHAKRRPEDAGKWYWDDTDEVRTLVRAAPTSAAPVRAAAASASVEGAAAAGGDDLDEQVRRAEQELAAERARAGENPTGADAQAARAREITELRARLQELETRNVTTAATAAGAGGAAAATARARTRLGGGGTGDAGGGGERRRSWAGRMWEGFKNLFRRTPAAARPALTPIEARSRADYERNADIVARAPSHADLARADAFLADQDRRRIVLNESEKLGLYGSVAKFERHHRRWPRWLRLTASLGVLAGGMAASSILAPMAAAAGISAIAAKATIAGGAAALNMALLHRPSAKRPILRAALTAAATGGLVGFADEAIAGVRSAAEWAGVKIPGLSSMAGGQPVVAAGVTGGIPIVEPSGDFRIGGIASPQGVPPELMPPPELGNPPYTNPEQQLMPDVRTEVPGDDASKSGSGPVPDSSPTSEGKIGRADVPPPTFEPVDRGSPPPAPTYEPPPNSPAREPFGVVTDTGDVPEGNDFGDSDDGSGPGAYYERTGSEPPGPPGSPEFWEWMQRMNGA